MTTTAPASDEWTESQLLENLRKLDELHRRLINLRTVIPTILYPLHAQYSTPTDLFKDFATRAATCSDDIAKFNTMYIQSRDIFAHAERSRERNRDGIQRLKGADMFLPDDDGDNGGGNEAAATSDDPVPAPQPSAETTAVEENKSPEPSLYDKQLRANFPVTLDGDVDALIAEAKERNPGVEIAEAASPKTGGRAWTVTLPKPVGTVVAVERGLDGKWMVTDVRAAAAGGGGAQTATHMAIFAAMGRAVNMLEGSGKFAMEMVVAYKSLYGEKCAKCGKVVKDGGQGKVEMPVVRKWETEGWRALHEDCANAP